MRHLKTVICALTLLAITALGRSDSQEFFAIKVFAKNKLDRNKVATAGLAIDGISSDSVTVYGGNDEVAALKALGIPMEVSELGSNRDFPSADSAYHNYAETKDRLAQLAHDYPAIATSISIGKSLEGRELNGIRISGNPNPDSLPTAIFLGCHHAREHLSVEIPLKLAEYLITKYATDARVKNLVDTREIYIVPMVNPDGAEYDIASGNYRYWRKNRRDNGGTMGVDLNRNYGGSGFGGAGSSSDGSSDIFHGPSAFSEPETLAVRDFVRGHKKTTVLLSFHTFSELVLWPWGHTDDSIDNQQDKKVFETMGHKMAEWNHYTPEKASELYLASGDTTDWAYEELKIFAFTFEMSPTSMFEGGFYPGAKAIEPAFQANIQPALYLIEKAENPYSVIRPSGDPLGMLD